jgi:peptidoglycan/LPS O-acetylase OafA/YrhL
MTKKNLKALGNEYKPFIDGLRAISILSVIVFHLNEAWMPGGFLGVDIFFLISGFVVTGSLVNRRSGDIGSMLVGFYSRRIKRLMPALLFCFVGVSTLTALLIPPVKAVKVIKLGVSSLFGMGNINLYISSNDYFNLATDFNPFTHTWSLGVEEQFYLFLPFLLLFFLGTGEKPKGVKNSSKLILILMSLELAIFILPRELVGKLFHPVFWGMIPISVLLFGAIVFYRSVSTKAFSRQKITASISFLVFFSLVVAQLLSLYKPNFAFYFMPARFWEIGLGVTLYFYCEMFSGSKKKMASFLHHLVVPAFIIIVLSFFLTNYKVSNPIPNVVSPLIATSFLIFYFSKDKSHILYGFLINKFNAVIGKSSYSLYLWHWPIIVFYRWTFGLNNLIDYINCIVLFSLCSLFSYFVIEKPVRLSHSRGITASILFFTVLIGAVFGFGATEKITKQAYIFNKIRNKMPGNHIEQMACHSSKPTNFKGCFTPDRKSNESKAIFVLGDSHAANHMPMLKRFGRSNGSEVLQLTSGELSLLTQNDDYKELLSHLETHLKAGDIVFTSTVRTSIYDVPLKNISEKTSKNLLASSAKMRITFFENLKNISNIIIKKGAFFILAGDIPFLRSGAISACIFQKKHSGKSTCDVLSSEDQKLGIPLNQVYSELAASENVFFWKPYKLLCEGNICSFNKDDHINYIDSNHLSKSASLNLMPFFRQFLDTSGVIF